MTLGDNDMIMDLIWKKNIRVCKNDSLKHDNLLDVDRLDLFSKLNILKEIIGLENDKPIDILNYIKRINSFPIL